MPSFSLIPHPDHPPLAVRGVEVEARRGEDRMLLRYQVIGAEKVIFPALASAKRADDLWRTTCFELFLRLDEDRYVEFNFSPSTCWAAYAFESYREGMAPLDLDSAPHVERLSAGIEVDCAIGDLLRDERPMALTAVIEEEGGVRSFWALAHSPGKPDFHDPACFAATLPARAAR